MSFGSFSWLLQQFSYFPFFNNFLPHPPPRLSSLRTRVSVLFSMYFFEPPSLPSLLCLAFGSTIESNWADREEGKSERKRCHESDKKKPRKNSRIRISSSSSIVRVLSEQNLLVFFFPHFFFLFNKDRTVNSFCVYLLQKTSQNSIKFSRYLMSNWHLCRTEDTEETRTLARPRSSGYSGENKCAYNHFAVWGDKDTQKTYIFYSDRTQEGGIDFICEEESGMGIQERQHLSWHSKSQQTRGGAGAMYANMQHVAALSLE